MVDVPAAISATCLRKKGEASRASLPSLSAVPRGPRPPDPPASGRLPVITGDKP
jgi:hypothetical protein